MVWANGQCLMVRHLFIRTTPRTSASSASIWRRTYGTRLRPHDRRRRFIISLSNSRHYLAPARNLRSARLNCHVCRSILRTGAHTRPPLIRSNYFRLRARRSISCPRLDWRPTPYGRLLGFIFASRTLVGSAFLFTTYQYYHRRTHFSVATARLSTRFILDTTLVALEWFGFCLASPKQGF